MNNLQEHLTKRNLPPVLSLPLVYGHDLFEIVFYYPYHNSTRGVESLGIIVGFTAELCSNSFGAAPTEWIIFNIGQGALTNSYSQLDLYDKAHVIYTMSKSWLETLDTEQLQFAIPSESSFNEMKDLLANYRIGSEWLVNYKEPDLLNSTLIKGKISGFIYNIDCQPCSIFIQDDAYKSYKVHKDDLITEVHNTLEVKQLTAAVSSSLIAPLSHHTKASCSSIVLAQHPMQSLYELMNKYPLLKIVKYFYTEKIYLFRVIGWVGDYKLHSHPNLILMSLDDIDLIIEGVSPYSVSEVSAELEDFWGIRNPLMSKEVVNRNFHNIVDQYSLYSVWGSKIEPKSVNTGISPITIIGYELTPSSEEGAVFSVIGVSGEVPNKIGLYATKDLRNKISSSPKHNPASELTGQLNRYNRSAGDLKPRSWWEGVNSYPYKTEKSAGSLPDDWESQFENAGLKIKQPRPVVAKTKKIVFKFKSNINDLTKVTLLI